MYTAEKVMEPPDEILIAILALSSPTDLPRIVCTRGGSRGKRGVRSTRRDSFERYTLDLDRENTSPIMSDHVTKILCFLFIASKKYRAKVSTLFYSGLVCFCLFRSLSTLFINNQLYKNLSQMKLLIVNY